MKAPFAWILFFLMCFAFGYFQGSSTEPITKNSLSASQKIQVLLTDEAFFPEELRKSIEQELNIQFSTIITRDWNKILASSIASPGADLILLPRNWAITLEQQNLLTDIDASSPFLKDRLFADFKISKDGFFFFPLFWLKTSIFIKHSESFVDFLKNKKQGTLFLLADEDLILRHFEMWESQGLLPLVQEKKILTLQLDELERQVPENSAVELPIRTPEGRLESDPLSALLVWGAVIPASAPQPSLALRVLNSLSEKKTQEQLLLKTPFNSTLLDVTGFEIPTSRRGDFIRELKLKNTIILDSKNVDAQRILKERYGFLL